MREARVRKLLVTASKASPLVLILFLLVATTQLALQLGVTQAGLERALARFSWLYAAVAVGGALAVVSGLLFESLVPPQAERRKGLIMDVLNRLTNRTAPHPCRHAAARYGSAAISILILVEPTPASQSDRPGCRVR
jgi:hypothetical protein